MIKIILIVTIFVLIFFKYEHYSNCIDCCTSYNEINTCNNSDSCIYDPSQGSCVSRQYPHPCNTCSS